MDRFIRHFRLAGDLLGVFADLALVVGEAVLRSLQSASRRLLGRRRLCVRASLPLAFIRLSLVARLRMLPGVVGGVVQFLRVGDYVAASLILIFRETGDLL